MFVTYIQTDKHTLWLPESLDLSDRETKNNWLWLESAIYALFGHFLAEKAKTQISTTNFWHVG